MHDDERPATETAAPLKRDLYPNYQHPVIREVPGVADEFDLRRELLLVGYGRNTARAYWGDLEHWRDWCAAELPPVDPLAVTDEDLLRYLGDLSAKSYAVSTQARRRAVLRKFRQLGERETSGR